MTVTRVVLILRWPVLDYINGDMTATMTMTSCPRMTMTMAMLMMMMTCVVLWYGDVTRLYPNDDGAVPAAAQTSLPVASRPSNFKSGKSALDFELTCTLLYLLRGTARHTGEISVQGLLCSTPEFYSEFFSGVYSRVYPPERQSTTGSLSLSRPPPSHLPLAQRTHIPHNLRSCCFFFGQCSERISKSTQLTFFLINIESSK